jgi:Tfp pilus assembly protein PilF
MKHWHAFQRHGEGVGRQRPATSLLVLAVLAALVAGCGPTVSEQAQRLSQNLTALAQDSFRNGDLGDALRKGLQAVETDPLNPDATYIVGFVYAARGEYTDAERYFKKTLELDDNYTDARNSLGMVYNNQGRYPEAIAILEEAVRDQLYVTPHLAMGNLGQAYLESGDAAKAVEWLLRAVREEPRFCVGYYRLGEAFVRKGDDASAEQALTSAVAIDDPGCRRLQPAWRMLGEVRLRTGNRASAAEAFAKCLEVDPAAGDGMACATALEGLQPPPTSGAPPAP